MRKFFLAAALAALTAAPAFAQGTPPAMNPAMMHMHAQMAQMHQQLRAQLLAALTPAHRALLASVAGKLATSANPDFDAAAAQLDKALSAGEKQKIQSAANAMRAKAESMMKNMPSPPPGHPMMGGGMMNGPMMHERMAHMTAGGILLFVALMPMHPMMMH